MFDFNDLLDNQKPVTARAVGVIFGGLLVAISSATSAAFFYVFAGEAFAFLFGDLSPWVSAAVGTLCYEIAALTWAWLRAHDADTAGQLAVANIAAWLTMAGGIASTVIYFGLTSNLIAPRLDDAALTAVSLIGGMLIVAGVAGNFAAGHVYRISAATHAAASQQAEIRAMQTGAQHAANREATYAILGRTLEEIRRQLPATSTQQGAANAQQYISERFTVAPQDAAARYLGSAEYSAVRDPAPQEAAANAPLSPNGRR